MIETDFVFLKPIQAPLAESDAPSIAFPYGYIQPTYPTIEVQGQAGLGLELRQGQTWAGTHMAGAGRGCDGSYWQGQAARAVVSAIAKAC